MKSDNSLSFVASRVRELMGFSLIVGALFFTVALLSNHPLDPSYNLSKDGNIYNLAGRLGAYFSGPILQAFGFAAYFYAIFCLVWGIRLICKQEASYFLFRVMAANIAVFFLAAFFDLFQVASAWSYVGYGGFSGSYLNSFFAEEINLFLYFLILWFLGAMFILPSLKLSVLRFWRLHYLLLMKIFNISSQNIKLFFESLGQKITHELKKKFFKNRIKDIDPTIKKNRAKIAKVTKEFDVNAKAATKNSYQCPATNNFAAPGKKKLAVDKSELNHNAKLLQTTLEDFGIKGKICDVKPGPVVTLYEFEPAPGIKSARIIGLADDVARSMSAVSARISLLPAKNALGIELPNEQREVVYLREVLESEEYKKTDLKLPLALGKDLGGDNIVADLAKMPHLLVAGTTGSGKSVAINTMILSLMCRLSPEQCKFIMIDPKMLELSVYEGIPHLLSPVITEAKKAVSSLAWVTQEMENRYRLMSALGVRNITGYNERISQAIKAKEVLTRTIQTGFDQDSGKPIFEDVELDMTPLPYIVLVIDEMADLMIVAGKEIESYLQRLAQMARASGIHIIIATQRPSVDVITGVIKANFPTRISFQVTSKIDSRTILGEQGAEQLLGMGDMLYMYSGSKILRVHGPFVSDSEVKKTVDEVKKQGRPNYIYEISTVQSEDSDDSNSVDDGEDDMFTKAVNIIKRDKKVSISYIQRQLRIGYNRAANIVEEMERKGIISAPNNNGKREILQEGGDDN